MLIGAAGKVVTAFDLVRLMVLGRRWVQHQLQFFLAMERTQGGSRHTGKCRKGVITQGPQRQKALILPNKAERARNFHRNALRALQALAEGFWLDQPSELHAHPIVRRIDAAEVQLPSRLIEPMRPGARLGPLDAQHNVFQEFWRLAAAPSFRAGAMMGTGQALRAAL